MAIPFYPYTYVIPSTPVPIYSPSTSLLFGAILEYIGLALL